ncbi:cytochrome P450 [Mycena floridula]|nr:cytochrome P450 [Mycena floridula]
MSTVSLRVVISLAVIPSTFVVWKASVFFYHSFTSPLRRLRGPPTNSWIFGNIVELIDYYKTNTEPFEVCSRWTSQYGTTLSFAVLFGSPQLMTVDPKALIHILTNAAMYTKSPREVAQWKLLLGGGLLAAQGDQHKNQRRILNPAFGLAQIRELTSIFYDKSLKLRDVWLSEIAKSEEKNAIVDVHPGLNGVTLDIIGLAGFNVEFDSLNPDGPSHELNAAVTEFLHTDHRHNIGDIIHHFLPWTQIIKTETDRRMARARKSMQAVGMELINQAKTAAEGEGINLRRNRDILSLLVRANAAETNGHQRLSDPDMLYQIPTFILAGHETTSSAVSLILYALTLHMDIQSKLREELVAVSNDTPSMDELNALPYLDAVIKESMRVHAPVVALGRVATQDDILPLTDGVLDRYGKPVTEILIKKGQSFTIPLLHVNKSPEIWGDDAELFRPERWQDIPGTTARVPSIWNHLMTFSTGPQSCIGYQFAVTEMKALIFTLVRAFEFELGVPASDIVKKRGIAQRPVVKGDPKGAFLLKIRPL